MKNCVHKKTVLALILIFLSFQSLNAIPLDNIKEYTLENGLTVFILQDTSTPLIRIEYTTRAGFSNQTKETSGFFKLYTRIFESACSTNGTPLKQAQCNADSSRYIITTVPSKLSQVFSSVAQCAFSLSYSDETLATQLATLKQEVKEEAASAGGFINAAIDSRVFSAFPWKHDSGVYPALFSKTTSTKARNILDIISSRYYTPQNSALFISGNINEETILSLIAKTFGQYYSSYSTPSARKSVPVNVQRKFVLHSPDFSQDMTQIVMQYTVLNMEECELAAMLFNNDSSFFKYNLINQTELNIPGNEYIDVSAAHKKDSSRLIIQSLIQKSSKPQTTSVAQTQLFTDTIQSAINETSSLEFYIAQQAAINNLSLINSSSTDFMTNLASYWALEQYDSFSEEVLDSTDLSLTAANLFSRKDKLAGIDFTSLINKINSEEPFIFVIINSSDYKKNKAKYEAAGFEEINTKNAAWYNQDFYSNYDDVESQDNFQTQQALIQQTDSLEYTNDFYTENLSSISKTTLSNNIPLILKENKNSSDITILLSIRGGKLNSAQNNGYEEVMINLLASNIQREIFKKQQEAVIIGDVVVDYNCAITSGSIIIECSPYDFAACCKAISDSIIYADILPSQADRAVSTVQYKKRLENGSVTRQMLFAVMKELYPKSDYQKIFDAKQDILLDTKYQKIMEGYPFMIDASRYSIIVTGLIPQSATQILDSTLGLLTARNTKQNLLAVQSKIKNSSTKKNVKLTHTFLTDVPAEKAGPMPAKLIPTTKFLDPVMYVFKLPQAGTKENTLTVAVLEYLEKLVQKNIDSNAKLKEAKAHADEPYANADIITFTILNVAEQKEADACFRNAVTQLNDLLNSNSQAQTIREIKDIWIEKMMIQTLSNKGTAELIQKGFELLPYDQQPELYLNEYNFLENATRQDFIEILKNIPQQPLLRFYAK